MNKFVCVGTHVFDPIFEREGKVICVNRKANVAVVQSGSHCWTVNARNLEVVSYKEVD